MLPWPLLIPFVIGLAAALALLARSASAVRAARARADAATRRVGYLVEAQERERERIGKALHDGAVQDLLALGMRAEVAAYAGGSPWSARAQGPGEPDWEEDLSRVTRELRTLSEALRPPSIGPFGLVAALGALADRFSEAHPEIRVELDLAAPGGGAGENDGLRPAARLALYRVAEEALWNAAVHGRPSRVALSLAFRPDLVRLEVRDDGAGYDAPGGSPSASPSGSPSGADAFAPSGRYGILRQRCQAEAVGGGLYLASRPGESLVRVDLPTPP